MSYIEAKKRYAALGIDTDAAIAKLKDVPVAIFSSLITPEMHRKGQQLGADIQMSKPEIGKLVGELDKLMLK